MELQSRYIQLYIKGYTKRIDYELRTQKYEVYPLKRTEKGVFSTRFSNFREFEEFFGSTNRIINLFWVNIKSRFRSKYFEYLAIFRPIKSDI